MVLSITVFNSIHYTKSMTYIAKSLMEQTSAKVLHQLNDETSLGAARSEFSAHMVEQGVLDDNESQLMPFTYDLTKALPLIDGAFWGDEKGNFVYSKEDSQQNITTELYSYKNSTVTRTTFNWDKSDHVIKRIASTELDYDPRVRPWYLQAKKEKKTIWTDIYYYKPIPDLGITVATPAYRHGKFYGVFGIDVNLKYLAELINKQRIREHGFCFIITKKGKLIVYPDHDVFATASPKKFEFLNVHDIPIPLISQSLDKFYKSGEKKQVFPFEYNGATYMVSYEPVPAFVNYEWLVGVVVPKSDFTKDLQSLYVTTLTIGIIILILGMIFISALISHIVQPIKLLVKETENIKDFNLEGEVVIKSRIKEIIYLKDSIHSMKKGLKLFQKYIPKILVKQLIESGEDVRVGGVRKKLTSFFSDIEGFTSICEKTDPNLLLIQMSEYFEELTQIIIKEKGTIDKYIGDSIMAFWGSPLPEAIPSHHAARAALFCQSRLGYLNAKWVSEGKVPLITRIGIHSGEAIVGNVGSSERLNYTAIGDSINIASRLEAINKNYKTRIIVSDVVYEQIKDAFILRFVDCVIVKGRSSGINIYELLSDNIQKIAFDITTYNATFSKGFHAYQQQQWDDAISYFNCCLDIYPTDNIAPIFIDRCAQFKLTPPDFEWNGVMHS